MVQTRALDGGSASLVPYDEIIVSIRESVTTAGDSGGGGGSGRTGADDSTCGDSVVIRRSGCHGAKRSFWCRSLALWREERQLKFNNLRRNGYFILIPINFGIRIR